MFAQFLGRIVAGQGVEVHAEAACLLGAVALGQERKYKPREHVAASGRRHSRIAQFVEIHVALGRADRCKVALQHNVEMVRGSHVDGLEQQRVRVRRTDTQALHLPRMRREDSARRHLLNPALVQAQDVDGVRIQHERNVYVADLFDEGQRGAPDECHER